MKGRKVGRRGFTLVELLIVVAIIGILATIGVPTFLRMVQKAKKSEAKLALSGLYTSLLGFFSEFGGYGNNLPQVGFEVSGDPSTRIYSIGFPSDNNCNSSAISPAQNTPVGGSISAQSPEYYQGNAITAYGSSSGAVCEPTTVSAEGAVFVAGAFGVIAPANEQGQQPNAIADKWVINQRRELSNCRDGINGGQFVDEVDQSGNPTGNRLAVDNCVYQN